MAEIGGYRELEAWEIGMKLLVEGYKLSASFPERERFGLTSQVRKALVSVPSNIAEGHARRSPGATVNHLSIALGSLAEVDTQMEAAIRLRFVSTAAATEFLGLLESCRRLTSGLKRAKQAKLAASVAAPTIILLLAVRLIS